MTRTNNSLLPHLAWALKAARRTAGCSTLDVAVEAGLDRSTIYSFERGSRWVADPDKVLAAYAAACGVPAREIVQAALNHWPA